MAGDRERCLEGGFDDYLTKPIHAATLASVVARVMGANLSPGGVPETKPLAEDSTAIDFEAALNDVGGDEELFVEILRIFIGDVPRLLAEIRLAVETNDFPTLRRSAHNLAGAASHFRSRGLINGARKLEALGKTENRSGAEDAIRLCAQEFDRFCLAAMETRFLDGMQSSSESQRIEPSEVQRL